MDNMYYNTVELKAAMLDTLFEMCREDSKDSSAYVYSYDRLAQTLEKKEDNHE